jgi:hypothetical protein
MSTNIELTLQNQLNLNESSDLKNFKTSASSTQPQTHSQPQDKQQHPLHQYDLTMMSKFYAACVGKLKEQNPKWQPTEWSTKTPMPQHLSWEQKQEWKNPFVFSQKQRVYEQFARYARETGEPMVLMPNFDYGDILNFERFLQALKQDGVNAIGKYKLYLNNKDMRKFEIDLVVIHPRYGVLLFEVKDCDHLDNKRRSRAKSQLNNARSCFESMARLVMEAKGWSHNEASLQVSDFIALPNVQERPAVQEKPANLLQTPGGNQNHSASSNSSNTSRTPRQLNYLIKSDLENTVEFGQWWQKYVAEPKNLKLKLAEEENKVNKFDLHAINFMLGLINCVRNNSIMPVVYPETDVFEFNTTATSPSDDKQTKEENSDEKVQFQPALNVHGEFFQSEHETVRSLSKVVILSKDSEKLRKTICLQTLWFLLNDSQKKISVVCSEANKAYYEEFFSRQRKLYNNLNNVRFYSDLQSCSVEGQHTLKKEGEIWFFDSGINGQLSEVIERSKELNAYWIFTTQEELVNQHKSELGGLKVKLAKLDVQHKPDQTNKDHLSMPWLTGTSLKFPLRLQCDLLIIGDIVGLTQLKSLYRYLKSNYVTNQASHYQNPSSSHGQQHYNQYHQPQQQQLNFNPSKKFRSVKFIRGGTIDNLRNSLKMHDSIQAQVILMHVGDEDLFKVRNSVTTVDRVKELATLVKEYCPKSFTIISTLMRRMSRTENGVTNDVNKGIINFCKQTRETLNCHYMMNSHFEPEYHTQEGRNLNNKGLRLYVDNLLFMVDYFLIRNNKQH